MDQTIGGLENLLRRIDGELIEARALHLHSTEEVERLEHQRNVVAELIERRT